MKKLLIIALVLFGYTATAQGVFKIGATAGVAASDAKEISDWALGVDAYYMFEAEDAILNFGPTVGFRNFFMSEDLDDVQFLPLAGAARIKLFGILNAGVDLGYAVAISDFVDGGLYYRPVVGLDIADTIELNVSFESISSSNNTNDVNWGNINVGVLFEF